MMRSKTLWLFTMFVLGVTLSVVKARGVDANARASGEIAGVIHYQGPIPKPKPIVMKQDEYCARVHTGNPAYYQDGEVNKNGTLPNAFVFITGSFKKIKFPVPRQPVTLDQQGCVYVPHVLGIMPGQKLRVVSSDLTTHNIHFLPKMNRSSNQSQTPGAAPFTRVFTHPEIMISVMCNQHPWMKAYIGVTSNPFYAVTGGTGTFDIHNVPAGVYTIEAWTATFGTQKTTVTVKPQETSQADFTFKSH